ncbi:MAG: type 1 glutamine amidotransferase, partial [Myxococcales bacterium]|nr:type 1 glutamine amidotransferase [Myxococcales bacterium]
MPTYRLLQARTPGDPVRDEERGSFAARLGVPVSDVLPYDCLSRRTDAREVADGVDAVLVGGSGKFSIFDPEPWLPAFIDALGALADDQVPMFASCFGFQGLVMALGGRVERDEDNAEVGTYALDVTGASADDPVFRGMPARFNAQLGHKDRATVLPEACVLLASSPRCPYQAFRVGTNV